MYKLSHNSSFKLLRYLLKTNLKLEKAPSTLICMMGKDKLLSFSWLIQRCKKQNQNQKHDGRIF